MRWQPREPGSNGQVSECGRYSVCVIGEGEGAFYEAWRTRKHAEGPHLVATCLNHPNRARECCDADALENP